MPSIETGGEDGVKAINEEDLESGSSRRRRMSLTSAMIAPGERGMAE